jgi:nitric oxide reductase subunit B
MVAQEPMRFWMLVVFLHGLVVLAGVVVTVTHLLTLKPERASAVIPLGVGEGAIRSA